MRGVRHGHYNLKMGCEHTARPLSPIVDQELGTSLELDNRVMRGIRQSCYNLKMGCEYTARLLSPTVDQEL